MVGKKEVKTMEVKVLFFGVLAEITGTNFKSYREAKSLWDLKLKIEDDFPEIVHYNYRISLNSEFINNNPALDDGDEIAFMPPFAGG
jgi:molybdopterin converting factor small subunit